MPERWQRGIFLFITASPGRDFTRSRKMGADRFVSFLVPSGSSGTRIELLDFFGLQAWACVFMQRMARLLPFFSKPSFTSPKNFVSEGHSAKGFCSMHLNLQSFPS